MNGSESQISAGSPLALRDYRLLLTGMVVGQALMPLQFVTQIFWIQQSADADVRIVLVGLIGTVRGAGQLCFGLVGGALADRYDRRLLLLATQSIALLTTLSTAAIISTGDATAPSLAGFFLLSFLGSGMFAMNAPTRQAIMSEVLGSGLLARGIALSAASMQIALPVAILSSGFLIDALGYAATYSLSAGGHATEIATLLFLRYRGTTRNAARLAGLFQDALRDIREGWRYSRAHDRVFWVIMLMMAMVGLGQPAVANLGPTWVTTVVGVPVRYFGLIAITWALGGILTAAYLARSTDGGVHGARVVAGALGFAAAFLLFASGHSWPFAVAGNLGLGASMSLAQISASSLLLTIVPNEVRGRVMSLLMLNMGVAQFVTLPLAALGQVLTLEVVFPVLAAVCFGMVALIALTRPVIRRGGPAMIDEVVATTPERAPV